MRDPKRVPPAASGPRTGHSPSPSRARPSPPMMGVVTVTICPRSRRAGSLRIGASLSTGKSRYHRRPMTTHTTLQTAKSASCSPIGKSGRAQLVSAVTPAATARKNQEYPRDQQLGDPERQGPRQPECGGVEVSDRHDGDWSNGPGLVVTRGVAASGLLLPSASLANSPMPPSVPINGSPRQGTGWSWHWGWSRTCRPPRHIFAR